jgi:hypothetical protein
MRQFSDAEEGLADFLEAQILAAIDAAKATTYNSAFVPAKYALLADALQVPAADIPFFLNDAKSIMQSDDFSRMGLEVIGDAMLSLPLLLISMLLKVLLMLLTMHSNSMDILSNTQILLLQVQVQYLQDTLCLQDQ